MRTFDDALLLCSFLTLDDANSQLRMIFSKFKDAVARSDDDDIKTYVNEMKLLRGSVSKELKEEIDKKIESVKGRF